MDDDSIKIKQSKSVFFYTLCFTFDDVNYLCRILKKIFNLLCKPIKSKESYLIYVYRHSL